MDPPAEEDSEGEWEEEEPTMEDDESGDEEDSEDEEGSEDDEEDSEDKQDSGDEETGIKILYPPDASVNVEDIVALAKKGPLKCVQLPHCMRRGTLNRLTAERILQTLTATQQRQLQKLDLSGMHLVGSHMMTLLLETNPHMQILILASIILHTDIKRDSLKQWLEMLNIVLAVAKHGGIRTLDLSDNNLLHPQIPTTLRKKMLLALSDLFVRSKLTYLDLSCNYLGPEGGQEVLKILERNTNLTTLKLCSNDLWDVPVTTSITMLDLTGNQDVNSNGTCGGLGRLLRGGNMLQVLILAGVQLSLAAVEMIAQWLKTTTCLRELDLSGAVLGVATDGQVVQENLEKIEALLEPWGFLHNPDTCDTLLQPWCTGPGAMDELVKSIQVNKTLTSLNLAGCNLGISGIEKLVKSLLVNGTLEKVDMRYAFEGHTYVPCVLMSSRDYRLTPPNDILIPDLLVQSRNNVSRPEIKTMNMRLQVNKNRFLVFQSIMMAMHARLGQHSPLTVFQGYEDVLMMICAWWTTLSKQGP